MATNKEILEAILSVDRKLDRQAERLDLHIDADNKRFIVLETAQASRDGEHKANAKHAARWASAVSTTISGIAVAIVEYFFHK
jgi:hypothetical protein